MRPYTGMFIAMLLIFSAATLAVTTGDPVKGKEIFSHRCAACHGTSGEGKEAIAKMFHVKMQPFSSKEVQDKSDAVLRKDVLEGNGKMLPVKLEDREMDDVLAFVRTLAKKK